MITPDNNPATSAVGDYKDIDRSWISRILFPGGKEPDPRFTLANERTFLAWMRSSLAFVAGGIALQLFPASHLDPFTANIGSTVVLLIGFFIATGAVVRWVRVERAMREGRPLPVPMIVPFVSLVAGIVCFVTLVLVLS
ncbi:YidH family protein [Corynebacterium hindlerae]|uniref:YidH family protein n=1 Tax=Corynebacterium hindlerae TaxID=699041 RepID=UPI003AAFBB35